MPGNQDQNGDISAEKAVSLIGAKLAGQYTLIDVLGQGGLGQVYRAQEEANKRQVAIKILPLELAKDEIIVKRMVREGKALGRLQHPNIVTTYHFGFTEKWEPYLVLELVDGESLQTYLESQGAMPVEKCLPLFIQLSDAMQYAHANGVVHRDLKPQNIMLIHTGSQTSAKVLDFGIAKMENESEKLTLTGEIWGSPHYMSPEQCTADPVDHLTDIYSLGILMYCMLSNRLPHRGKAFAEVVSQKMFEPAPSFAALDLPQPIEVPIGLEIIVLKCLKSERADRYQSMEELKLALEAFAKKSGLAGVAISDDPGHGQQLPAKAVSGKSGQGQMPAVETVAGRSEQQRVRRPVSTLRTVDSPGQGKSRLILPVMALMVVLIIVAVAIFFGLAHKPHM